MNSSAGRYECGTCGALFPRDEKHACAMTVEAIRARVDRECRTCDRHLEVAALLAAYDAQVRLTTSAVDHLQDILDSATDYDDDAWLAATQFVDDARANLPKRTS